VSSLRTKKEKEISTGGQDSTNLWAILEVERRKKTRVEKTPYYSQGRGKMLKGGAYHQEKWSSASLQGEPGKNRKDINFGTTKQRERGTVSVGDSCGCGKGKNNTGGLDRKGTRKKALGGGSKKEKQGEDTNRGIRK